MCNLPGSGEQPTTTPNITQAYETVAARLTQAVTPTVSGETTPQPTPSPVSLPTTSAATPKTPPPTAAPAPTNTQPSSKPCDQAAAGNPIDVTIPDDTVMQPGQAFTKIWRLVNVGTCTWTKDYALTYFSGEQMGMPANVPLRGDVRPGETVDIAADMIAPKTAGKYQGNWKLRNASNVLFGIGPSGGSPFWVRIVVAETATQSPTASTPTTSPTPTATPPSIQASGSPRLNPGDQLNLDTLAINSGSDDDLVYGSDSQGKHPLVPLGNAMIGVYGSSQPSLSICQQASLTNLPVIIDDLPVGTYICYRTTRGLIGRARVSSFNVDTYGLELEVLTWSAQ
jgi:hypothetical protein